MFYFLMFVFCLPSFAIFNLKTSVESKPLLGQKKWIAVAQGCHSCDELLKDLEAFCKGKKPSPQKLAFLITGSSVKKMKEKLKSFKDYEWYSGSPNELYENYKIMGSPTLKTPKKGIVGKKAILKFLKKSSNFCL